MVVLKLIPDGTRERSGPDFDPTTALHVQEPVTVIGIPEGTAEGRATVILRATLPNGLGEVWIETTLRLFCLAADGLRARYGPQE
jgi:hypothetical protein